MRKWLIAVCLLIFPCTVHAELGKGDVPNDELGVDAQGNAVTSSLYRGKVLVVSFWASWCGYCLKELPVLENLQRAAGKQNLQVVAINYKESRSQFRAIVRRLKMAEMTLTHDPSGRLAKPYNIKGLPFLILIDRSGRIAYLHRGYAESMLDDIVDQINGLLQEPVAAAPTARGARPATAVRTMTNAGDLSRNSRSR
ncbi:MAG: TlpA family protein disulfide reductase [Xanthomonadales bacterium]|nr:TlpA family protein disulfide reductase [Xanthomonadales bacterium]